MSTLYDKARKLAHQEAKRTNRPIAIMRCDDQDDGLYYDLVFADQYPGDPEIIETVYPKRHIARGDSTYSTAVDGAYELTNTTYEEGVAVLKALFERFQPPSTLLH